MLIAGIGLAITVRYLYVNVLKPTAPRFKRGAIVGKFYPPHKGHGYLIEKALSMCDKLTVIVCFKSHERPTGSQRGEWIRQIHGNDRLEVLVKENIYNDDANSKLWADLTKEFLGYTPDVVFTSELYGEKWAEYLGCKHVLVDLKRVQHSISGTAVRSDPFGNFDQLHPIVRQYYSKQVCIIGAESTGKTILSNRLAMHYFGAGIVGEYGREKTMQNLEERGVQEKGKDFETPEWRSEDFLEIATVQNDRVEQAMGESPLVFSDTNAMVTQIWHERYMGYESPDLNEYIKNKMHEPDLYLLCVVDGVPFVQDGTRGKPHTTTGYNILYKTNKYVYDEINRRRRENACLDGQTISRCFQK